MQACMLLRADCQLSPEPAGVPGVLVGGVALPAIRAHPGAGVRHPGGRAEGDRGGQAAPRGGQQAQQQHRPRAEPRW